MGRQSHEPVAFGEAFADEADLAIFQIPQPAMDEPCRPGRGTGGDVVTIDDDHVHAGKREFPGDGGAVDPRPEHDDCCVGCHDRLSSSLPPAVCSMTCPER